MTSLNVNVGVLGHVDSGKTSLVEQLSTVLSTAALDKHPQSQERGITLDLGFSALQVPIPERLRGDWETLQFTFVDCPGHASLIRTVLGGAHIMDMMILVVDITKGIQVQTAECLVIGEITVDKLLVVLNKVDLIAAEKRDKIVEKAKKRVAQTLKITTFKDAKILPVSSKTRMGVDTVVEELVEMVSGVPERRDGPFLFAIDHCFRIKGQGTVLTGTALQGRVAVHDSIELPVLQEVRKVKSIQMFKKAVGSASAGDRAGICVTNLDPTRLERGLAATPGTLSTFQIAVASVERVRFYADAVKSGQKLHVMMGHDTTLAKLTFFKSSADDSCVSLNKEYPYSENLEEEDGSQMWALIAFDSPMTVPADLPLVAARLDGDSSVSSCRLALHGRIDQTLDAAQSRSLKIFKVKERQGFVKEMMGDSKTALCTGMFKKETDFSHFIGLPVMSSNGKQGKLQKAHGNDGDFLVRFNSTLTLSSEEDRRITLFSKKYLTH